MTRKIGVAHGIALGTVVALTALVYWQVRGFEFVYDDNYLLGNRWVQGGLTWESFRRALGSLHGSNWMPVSWWSHLLDVSLFGSNPAGHHLVNLSFHLLNTVLLAAVLARLTGASWRSVFVAGLFALHPLHVESVAWVAERRDVLSGTFFLLTLLAYAGYAARPGVKRYLVVVLCFAFGLMAKPMLVTLPFVLLLLDWWPLRRMQPSASAAGGAAAAPEGSTRPVRLLLLEKVPLLVLSLSSSAITVIAQGRGGAMVGLGGSSLFLRVQNAVVAYATYILKTFWPSHLAVLYPYRPAEIPAWQVVGAALALGGVTAAVIRWGRTRGYLPVGWLWYLGTMVPVIGLVQVGVQARADRFTYLPLIGVFVMLVWLAGELAENTPRLRPLVVGTGVLILALLSAVTWRQIGYWRNAETLFGRAIEVTRDNFVARNNLGLYLSEHGRNEEALQPLLEALQTNPSYVDAMVNLALALQRLGRDRDALRWLEEAARRRPDSALIYTNLGVLYGRLGRSQSKFEAYRKAIRADPSYEKAYFNLALAYLGTGNVAAARQVAEDLAKFNPAAGARLRPYLAAAGPPSAGQ